MIFACVPCLRFAQYNQSNNMDIARYSICTQQIQALSQALKIPIEVYQANAPVLKTGEQYFTQPILLS